jgi:hypothetical protein
MSDSVRRMGDVVSQLLARRGYAQIQASQELEAIVRESLDPRLAGQIRIGRLRAGTLELVVRDSVVLQELSFQQATLLAHLQSKLTTTKLKRLRLLIG